MVAVGTAFAFTLSGCTVASDGSWEFPGATHAPADPAEQDPLYGGAEAARRLLGSNAAIHIIDVQVTNAKTAKKLGIDGDKDAKKFVKDLHNPAGKFRTTLAKTFTDATLGRYRPAAVTYEKAKPLALEGGCVNKWNDAELQPLLNTIDAAAKPDQVNVAVVEAFSCKPPEGENWVGGFASPDMVPIVLQSETSYAKESSVHEVGHHFGLSHAGTAECEDMIQIRKCTVSEVDDSRSIMSYTSANKFTAAELDELGLLRDDEVVDLRGATAPQEVTLTDMSHDDGVKLIIAKTAIGNDLYLSWAQDTSAGSDENCVKTKAEYGVPKGVNEFKDYLYWRLYTTKSGKEINYACYQTNQTDQDHSLQMRVASGEADGQQVIPSAFGSLSLVTSKGQKVKGTDWYINQGRPFINPPESVYAGGNDALPIAYVSADHDKAVVRIG